MVVGIAAGVIASGIGPLTKQEDYLPRDHPVIITQTLVEENFSSTSSLKEAIVIKLNWGVEGLNRENVGLWDPEDLGEIIWDDSFTVAPKAN